MTVCIASLAEDGKKAVLIADKLVTNTGILPYQIDMAADKIKKITDNVYVMYSGGISYATVVIDSVLSNLGKKKWVTEIADLVNDKHLELLQKILVRQHLISLGANDARDFYQNYSNKLDAVKRNLIEEALTSQTINLSFIVCGKNQDGNYRVYWLNNNPRMIPNLNTSGYSVIGSGWNYANVSIIKSQYLPSLSIEKVSEIVIKAKKEAEENDRDVGNKEDIIILE